MSDNTKLDVATVVASIELNHDSERAEFLTDPGGFLATWEDADLISDQVAAEAIAIISARWANDAPTN